MPAEHTISTHTENIGAGGVRVIIDEKLDIFSTVGFELHLQSKIITGKGRIVWVVDKPLENMKKAVLYDTGMEFRELADVDRKFISDFVDKVVENKK